MTRSPLLRRVTWRRHGLPPASSTTPATRSWSAAAGLPIDAGRARTLVARALLANDETAAARAELERARDELAAVGAGHYADEAAQELRRIGVRVARSERPAPHQAGLDSLSAREREIAQLAAAGRRNREIADSLFV